MLFCGMWYGNTLQSHSKYKVNIQSQHFTTHKVFMCGKICVCVKLLLHSSVCVKIYANRKKTSHRGRVPIGLLTGFFWFRHHIA